MLIVISTTEKSHNRSLKKFGGMRKRRYTVDALLMFLSLTLTHLLGTNDLFLVSYFLFTSLLLES